MIKRVEIFLRIITIIRNWLGIGFFSELIFSMGRTMNTNDMQLYKRLSENKL